jgi:RNA-binding protein 8A
MADDGNEDSQRSRAVSSWNERGEEAARERSFRAGPVKSVEGWVVFVTGLHEETSEDDVSEAFSEVGRVNLVRMNFDRRTGGSKGHALVEFELQSEAQDAINKMHGVQLLGKTIAVHWAFVRPTGQTALGLNTGRC